MLPKDKDSFRRKHWQFLMCRQRKEANSLDRCSPLTEHVMPVGGTTLWSWRESNPRPHGETIRFLHAYSGLCFRAVARPGPPTTTLASKFSPLHRGLQRLFPMLLRRLFHRIREHIRGATSRPCALRWDKASNYYTSFRQREHTRCCQLIFCQL